MGRIGAGRPGQKTDTRSQGAGVTVTEAWPSSLSRQDIIVNGSWCGEPRRSRGGGGGQLGHVSGLLCRIQRTSPAAARKPLTSMKLKLARSVPRLDSFLVVDKRGLRFVTNTARWELICPRAAASPNDLCAYRFGKYFTWKLFILLSSRNHTKIFLHCVTAGHSMN